MPANRLWTCSEAAAVFGWPSSSLSPTSASIHNRAIDGTGNQETWIGWATKPRETHRVIANYYGTAQSEPSCRTKLGEGYASKVPEVYPSRTSCIEHGPENNSLASFEQSNKIDARYSSEEDSQPERLLIMNFQGTLRQSSAPRAITSTPWSTQAPESVWEQNIDLSASLNARTDKFTLPTLRSAPTVPL
ncbi:hypothetical protein EI94DRAFT_1708130 [Lactarius quietus]|nr:hypothetical protein EI94DRAFT_1708130 [Lactarius quietus]